MRPTAVVAPTRPRQCVGPPGPGGPANSRRCPSRVASEAVQIYRRKSVGQNTATDAVPTTTSRPTLAWRGAFRVLHGTRTELHGSCCSRSIGRGLRLLEYRPWHWSGRHVDSDGSCFLCSIGRGLRLLEYRPRQEAGCRVDSEERCCLRSVGCGLLSLRGLEYCPRQEAGSLVDLVGSCFSR